MRMEAQLFENRAFSVIKGPRETNEKRERSYVPHVSLGRYIEIVQAGTRRRRGLDKVLL